MSDQTLRCLGCDRKYVCLADAVLHRGETGHTVVRDR